MKLITNKLSRFSAFFLLTIYSASILTGCFQHYFRTGTLENPGESSLQTLMRSDKFYILHAGDNISSIANLHVSGDLIEGDLMPLPPEHSKYLHPDKSNMNRVKKQDKMFTLTEIHLYIDKIDPAQKHVSFPVTSLKRLDVYEFDKKSTMGNHILSWVGVGILGISVITTIAFLIACNCPQVYYADNGQFEFKSGVYSGAVNSTLERTDYLPLPGIKPTDNTFNFRIKNLPEEEQFINQVQLMSVEHPDNVYVLTDRNGNPLSYQHPLSAEKAWYNGKEDATAQVKAQDGDVYAFQSRPGENGLSTLNLQFKKPDDAEKGKLLIHAGNSRWSGYLNKEFNSLFGSGYAKWRQSEEEKNTPNAGQWMLDQGLPIKVWVETANGWEYADHYALTGNTASRDMIMQVDLSKVKGEIVNIRLECAYQFWDLDYAGMDYTKDDGLKTEIVNASIAKTSEADLVSDQLSAADKRYVNLKGDDYADLQFPSGTTSNKSYFLVSTGYYHIIKTGTGKPDLNALAPFREKGYFDVFSRSKYASMEQELAKARVKN